MTPEEALRHAYAADIARLPPEQQVMFNAEQMAANHIAGKTTPAMDKFRRNMMIGHPSYRPSQAEGESPEDFLAREAKEIALQDQMLSGYTGKGWTPEQLNGRTPESYEFSPGGQYLDQLDNRRRLYSAFNPQDPDQSSLPSAAAWAGVADPGAAAREGAAKLYAQGLDRKYAYLPGSGPGTMFPGIPEGGFQELWNPENFVGSFTTKMGGAVSDGLSHLGTALLRDTDLTAAAGNAATRSQGADFFRTNPALAKDNGWRANDELLAQGQDGYYRSEGMNAGDTFRSIGNHVLPESWNGQLGYAQPFINAGISFLNGAMDGTGIVGSAKGIPNTVRSLANGVARTGVPGVAKFARSTADDITKHLTAKPTFGGRVKAYTQDEFFDPTTALDLVAELPLTDTRSNTEWNDYQKQLDESRQQAFKQLESVNDQIVRPQTTVTKAGNAIAPYAAKPLMHTGNALSKTGSFFRGLLDK